MYLSVYLSVYLSICKIKNEESLRDFLNGWTKQRQKRNKSARHLHFLNLTTSETKQFCETSSFFEGQGIKYERILRDVLQKWKVEFRADSLLPMRFAIFPVHLSKVLRLPRKIDARSYEVLRLPRKIILANLHIWYSKMQPLSGNQRPDLLTSLMNMSFVLRLPRKCIFADPLQMPHACHHSWKSYKTLTFWSLLTRCTIPCACHAKRHLNLQKWCEHVIVCTFWLRNVLRATTACTFSTSQLPKVVRTPSVLCILTWKCASRHNDVHFFDISTVTSGPRMVCFVHFDLEMCFAPQRRALFRHLNFQKWSDNGVFCTFWLRNVLRATTACTFSTSQVPKVVRTPSVFHILTWKCASRHNGVQFSSLLWPAGSATAALASLLFDPPEPQIIGKTQWIATFLPFRASPSSFFLLFLFYSSLFWSFSSLCLFPALLFICPYCRKFDF